MGGGGKKLKNVVVIYITIDVETSEKTKQKFGFLKWHDQEYGKK